MLAAALVGVSAAVVTAALPYIHIPALDLGIPIQPFGVLVATGVLLGAELARRYALRRGVDDDDMRTLTGWSVACGFIGAHVFDAVFYNTDKLLKEPILILKLWDGISSYGGFIGGITGLLIYLWRHKKWPALFADIAMVGMLPGFTIGRIGCSIVHDHIGSPTHFVLGVDYPVEFARQHGFSEAMRLHNLGFYELLYLIPINVLVLWLAFGRKRNPAGLLAALTAALYAPVRFFLEFLRLDDTDPRRFGLTFAQWMSIAALLAAIYAVIRIIRRGVPAPLAEELDGKKGGGRPPKLPDAVAGAAPAAGAAPRKGAGSQSRRKRGKTE